MIMRASLVSMLLLIFAGLGGCDQGSSSGGKSKRSSPGDMTPAMDPDMTGPDSMASTMGAGGDAMDGKITHPSSGGPTGIVDCDRLLETVCRCQTKHAALETACTTLKRDAPEQKAQLGSKDPKQVEETRLACVRSLTEVQSAFACQ
jgi:hypothetical protein